LRSTRPRVSSHLALSGTMSNKRLAAARSIQTTTLACPAGPARNHCGCSFRAAARPSHQAEPPAGRKSLR
jgi:hypothetical protein